MRALQQGEASPILRRWVAASVAPCATRLREVARAMAEGESVSELLSTPVFGLASLAGHPSLTALLHWCLQGSSPLRQSSTSGDAATAASFSEDIMLTALGSSLSSIIANGASSSGNRGLTLNSCISSISTALRECVMGQWLTNFQGPETLLAMERRAGGASWKKRRLIDGSTRVLLSQVKPQIQSHQRGEIVLETWGNKSICKVLLPQRDGTELERMVTLRMPQAEDWEVLRLAQKTRGEDSEKAGTWATFSLMLLCIIQKEHGWFDIISERPTGKRSQKKGRQRFVVLSEEAAEAIGKDARAWAEMGFINQPMITPPEKGDYLSVKHKAVANKGAPSKEARTQAEGSWQWETAGEVLAGTPWYVNREAHEEAAHSHEIEEEYADIVFEKRVTDPEERLILADHARLGSDPFWLPIYMDFRGRVYPRTRTVSYQGGDLQKSLLMFGPTNSEAFRDAPEYVKWGVIRHMHGLYGKYDKCSKEEQMERWFGYNHFQPEEADQPLQFAAHKNLMAHNWNSIPVQLDGTCNGLQHISAMFRDEVAAPYVNLCDRETPQDIYGKVAEIVKDRLLQASINLEDWAQRFLFSNVNIDRKLCKKPVMTLPYGATLQGVEEFIYEGLLAQKPLATPWREVLTYSFDRWVPDDGARASGYLAYGDRELARHPLFKSDAKKLARLVWDAISEALPKAMAAMSAFRGIAKHIGENAIEWNTGVSDRSLRVVQAKSKAAIARIRLKGLHLPQSVRSIQTIRGKGEIDKTYHRSGIIANFIHSCDADHMARTMREFRQQGGTCFGAAHDCFMARPSEIRQLHAAIRGSFIEKYSTFDDHPLYQAVVIKDIKGKVQAAYRNWFELASSVGVSFPEFGSFPIGSVITSQWFFS